MKRTEQTAKPLRDGLEPTTGELYALGCGRTLGRYTLLRRVATGGMAEVYVARARGPDGTARKVAIKKILPELAHNDRFIDMLVDEAKITVLLTHPSIAEVHELGLEGDDTYFIVMEYVAGRPLSRVLQRMEERRLGPVPIEHAAHILTEVARGLEHAHAMTDDEGRPLGIVHRDITPQNVLLANSGEVKLIDFGIARAENRIARTHDGVIKGKLRYLAPEIALGQEPDHRADLFCCGIVLFEMLTGEALFAPTSDLEAIQMASEARVRSPRSANPAIPEALEQIVMRALRRDRDERYPSARELAADLQRFMRQHYPSFTRDELGDLMSTMFHEEILLERRLDYRADQLAEDGVDPGIMHTSVGPTPSAPAASEESGSRPGYRKLVTRLGIGDGGGARVNLVGADGGEAMAIVLAPSDAAGRGSGGGARDGGTRARARPERPPSEVPPVTRARGRPPSPASGRAEATRVRAGAETPRRRDLRPSDEGGDPRRDDRAGSIGRHRIDGGRGPTSEDTAVASETTRARDASEDTAAASETTRAREASEDTAVASEATRVQEAPEDTAVASEARRSHASAHAALASEDTALATRSSPGEFVSAMPTQLSASTPRPYGGDSIEDEQTWALGAPSAGAREWQPEESAGNHEYATGEKTQAVAASEEWSGEARPSWSSRRSEPPAPQAPVLHAPAPQAPTTPSRPSRPVSRGKRARAASRGPTPDLDADVLASPTLPVSGSRVASGRMASSAAFDGPTTTARLWDWTARDGFLVAFIIVAVAAGMLFGLLRGPRSGDVSSAAAQEELAIALRALEGREPPATPLEPVVAPAPQVVPTPAPTLEAPKLEAPKLEAPTLAAESAPAPGSSAEVRGPDAPAEAARPARDPRSLASAPAQEAEAARVKPPETARAKAPETARAKAPEAARAKAPETARAKAPETARAKAPEAAQVDELRSGEDAEGEDAPEDRGPSLSPPEPRGTLFVNARPVSVVYVDGRRRGPTPIWIRLSPGKHKVMLKAFGGATTTSIRVIESGKTTTLTHRWER